MLAAGIFSLFYYLVICIYVKRWNSTFSRVWLCAGCCFVFCSFISAYISEYIRNIAAAAGGIFCAAVFVTGIRMCCFLRKREEEELDYVIVLGAKVDKRRITISLRFRLDKAIDYLQKNSKTKVIVSGGKGAGEEIAEAEAMAGYLGKYGILKDRIMEEGKSRTTEENLIFSLRLIPQIKTKKVGIITNSFHMYRACMIGKRVGYETIFPITAKSEPILFLNYFLREILAVLIYPFRIRLRSENQH